jgi:hypothetical protein
LVFCTKKKSGNPVVDPHFQIIRTHRNDPNLGSKYVTIESMTAYEVDSDLIKTKAKDCSTGSR